MDSPQETEVVQETRGKRRRWRAPLAAVILLLLAAVAFYVARFGRLKGTEPYRMALDRVKQAEEVVQRLGSPVDDVTWFPSGEVVTEGGRARARFTFIVAGPRGKATVLAQANRVDDRWALTLLDVAFDNGDRVSLRQASGGSSSGEAPRWQPGGGAQPGTAAPAMRPGVSPSGPQAPTAAQPGSALPGQSPAAPQPGPLPAQSGTAPGGQAPQVEIDLPKLPQQ